VIPVLLPFPQSISNLLGKIIGFYFLPFRQGKFDKFSQISSTSVVRAIWARMEFCSTQAVLA